LALCRRQLFNSIHPSPFHERDLDESAERFITNWASDLPRNTELSLEIGISAPKEVSREETRKMVELFTSSSGVVLSLPVVNCAGPFAMAP
jgi:hypothetical protein